jgi:hypothetical protein
LDSFRCPSSGAVSSPVSAPLVVVRPRYHTPTGLHTSHTCVPYSAHSTHNTPLAAPPYRTHASPAHRGQPAVPAVEGRWCARPAAAALVVSVAAAAAAAFTAAAAAIAAAADHVCGAPAARSQCHHLRTRTCSLRTAITCAPELALRRICKYCPPLSSLPPVCQVVRDQKPVQIAEEAGEQSQEQGVEHVGQRQAFCNRGKGGTARVVFARRLRLLPAISRCSAMNIIMLHVGCKSAWTKINACCCACWQARMSA